MLSYYSYPLIAQSFDKFRYLEEIEDKTVEDKYSFSISIIGDDNYLDDEILLKEVLKQLIQDSRRLQKNEDFLFYLELLISKLDKNTDMYGYAYLVKARLQMRLDLKEDAMFLFNQGVLEKWKDNAFWELNSSLIETNQYKELAIDEYRRNSTDEYNKELREYYGIGHDLSNFFIRLNECKVNLSDFNAMNDVYSYLEESTWRPIALESAKALCLAIDGKFAESSEVLEKIEDDCKNLEIEKNEHEEWKYIPLYKLINSFINSNNLNNEIQQDIDEFINRNQEYPTYVINRLLELIYTLDDIQENYNKISNITESIISHPYFIEKSNRNIIPVNKWASVYDKHQQSLAYQGRYSEAIDVCSYAISNYYPKTLAGANCAMSYANYINMNNEKINEAESIYLDILQKTRFPSIKP